MPSSSDTPRASGSLTAAAEAIDRVIATAQQPLVALSESFVKIYGSFFGTTDSDPVSLDTKRLEWLASELEPQCLAVLDQPAPRLIEGIGLVWVAPQDASGMLWWRAEQERVARKHHVFNPDSDSFYDYRNSVWFLGARAADGLSIVGPYIDSWGTDDHTLTASMTMLRDGHSVGVAASDLNLQNLTDQVGGLLSELPPAVLVGSEDRVIASNVALLTPGLRLEPFLKKSGARVSENIETVLESWRLLRLK